MDEYIALELEIMGELDSLVIHQVMRDNTGKLYDVHNVRDTEERCYECGLVRVPMVVCKELFKDEGTYYCVSCARDHGMWAGYVDDEEFHRRDEIALILVESAEDREKWRKRRGCYNPPGTPPMMRQMCYCAPFEEKPFFESQEEKEEYLQNFYEDMYRAQFEEDL